MMSPMNLKHHGLRVYARVATAVIPLLLPALALAKPTEEDSAFLEGRFDGYATPVRLTDAGTSGLTWMMFIFVSMIALAVLFKDAKRSHLD